MMRWLWDLLGYGRDLDELSEKLDVAIEASEAAHEEVKHVRQDVQRVEERLDYVAAAVGVVRDAERARDR